MLSDYVAELKGYLPTASPFLLTKLVNRAFQTIRDAAEWSWLEGFTVIQVPALVSTGSISYTQYTPTIHCDATATAALTPLISSTVFPLVAQRNSANQPLVGTGYNIRITSGPLYYIIAASGNPLTITVDRIISEPSVTTVGYQAYRAYLNAPSTDFLSWTSIVNVQQGYSIQGQRLLGSQAFLNWIDPQRSSTEDFYFLYTLYTDANGMPAKEMWPGPVNSTGYLGYFKRRGTDLSATIDIPPSLPVNLLLERARMLGAQWRATQPRDPADTTDWVATWKTHELNYQGELASAIKKDTSLKPPKPIIRRGPGQWWPFSSQFTANHDVMRLLGAGFPQLGYGWY